MPLISIPSDGPLGAKFNRFHWSQLRQMSRSELKRLVSEGARQDAVCLDCKHNTLGSRCHQCQGGFFRGSASPDKHCRP